MSSATVFVRTSATLTLQHRLAMVQISLSKLVDHRAFYYSVLLTELYAQGGHYQPVVYKRKEVVVVDVGV